MRIALLALLILAAFWAVGPRERVGLGEAPDLPAPAEFDAWLAARGGP